MASHVCLCSKWAKPRRKGCLYNPSSTLRPPSPQFKQLLDTLFNFTMVFFCTKEKGSGCFSLVPGHWAWNQPNLPAKLRSELAAGICLWPCATRPLPHGFLVWTHCRKWTGKWGSACAYASPETHHSQKVHCKGSKQNNTPLHDKATENTTHWWLLWKTAAKSIILQVAWPQVCTPCRTRTWLFVFLFSFSEEMSFAIDPKSQLNRTGCFQGFNACFALMWAQVLKQNLTNTIQHR